MSSGTLDLTSLRSVFENGAVTPDKLALLTDDELGTLADRMGLNLPPGLDRPFILEEIVDAFNDDTEERRFPHDAPSHVEEKKFAGTSFGLDAMDPSLRPATGGFLSDRYGETIIHALVRDPGWVFAYWDISERHRPPEYEDDERSFILRVCELSLTRDPKRDYFDIPVTSSDFQWYINLPHPGARYRIDLISFTGGRLRIIARSNEVSLPRHRLETGASLTDETTCILFRLSGGYEFNIVQTDQEENPCGLLLDHE